MQLDAYNQENGELPPVNLENLSQLCRQALQPGQVPGQVPGQASQYQPNQQAQYDPSNPGGPSPLFLLPPNSGLIAVPRMNQGGPSPSSIFHARGAFTRRGVLPPPCPHAARG